MSNLSFLLVAIGASVLGSFVLWLRYRSPRRFGSSVEEFRREMHALGRPLPDQSRRPRRLRRRRDRPPPIVPAQHPDEAVHKLREARRRDAGAG